MSFVELENLLWILKGKTISIDCIKPAYGVETVLGEDKPKQNKNACILILINTKYLIQYIRIRVNPYFTYFWYGTVLLNIFRYSEKFENSFEDIFQSRRKCS